MASTYTPNVQLNEPARGDDVGTWDVPVNSNSTQLDLMIGGIAVQALNNSNVVLSAAQFQARNITFNSTLTGNVIITFPTSFTKSYEIQNLCTGSSAFTVTLETTASGGQVICCPPGETVDVFNDGTNLKFKNLGRVGEYWDYAGSSVPAWVSGCTIPPYVNCDGSSFNPATYPYLTTILGGTVLPDTRGRSRYALNQGTGRITAGGNAIDGNTRFAAGGTEFIAQNSLPNVNFTVSGITLSNAAPSVFVDATTTGPAGNVSIQGSAGGSNGQITSQQVFTAVTVATQGSAASGGSGVQITSPGYVGGLTLIRAA